MLGLLVQLKSDSVSHQTVTAVTEKRLHDFGEKIAHLNRTIEVNASAEYFSRT